MNDDDPIIAPAVLGWSNPDTGPWSTRLYGKDDGPSPRWAKPHARVVEQSLELLTGPGREGDRYLVVRVGDRFVSDERVEALAAAIAELVAATPPVGGTGVAAARARIHDDQCASCGFRSCGVLGMPCCDYCTHAANASVSAAPMTPEDTQ